MRRGSGAHGPRLLALVSGFVVAALVSGVMQEPASPQESTTTVTATEGSSGEPGFRASWFSEDPSAPVIWVGAGATLGDDGLTVALASEPPADRAVVLVVTGRTIDQEVARSTTTVLGDSAVTRSESFSVTEGAWVASPTADTAEVDGSTVRLAMPDLPTQGNEASDLVLVVQYQDPTQGADWRSAPIRASDLIEPTILGLAPWTWKGDAASDGVWQMDPAASPRVHSSGDLLTIEVPPWPVAIDGIEVVSVDDRVLVRPGGVDDPLAPYELVVDAAAQQLYATARDSTAPLPVPEELVPAGGAPAGEQPGLPAVDPAGNPIQLMDPFGQPVSSLPDGSAGDGWSVTGVRDEAGVLSLGVTGLALSWVIDEPLDASSQLALSRTLLLADGQSVAVGSVSLPQPPLAAVAGQLERIEGSGGQQDAPAEEGDGSSRLPMAAVVFTGLIGGGILLAREVRGSDWWRRRRRRRNRARQARS